MFVVTGAAGFIGSHLVAELNARGVDAVIAVDDAGAPERTGNLAGLRYQAFLDKAALLSELESGRLDGSLTAVLHQGACSDTLEEDERFLHDNNVDYSRRVLDVALAQKVPFVYASSASVYGRSRSFEPFRGYEGPLNAYGRSKLAFDEHVRPLLDQAGSSVVGLRYFNVYGPRERHKGRMASMVYQLYRQLRDTGTAKLFAAMEDFAAGEQRRDFVFVEDVVRVNLFFATQSRCRGVFNVGTGRSWTFNKLAGLLGEALGGGGVEYIDCPEHIVPRYQSYTQADLSGLRQAGYDGEFRSLEAGIARCLEAWGS
jgi:ADP-L-glycero-D-manno-heptose 6-epimerase